MLERVGGLAGIAGTGSPALLAGGAKAMINFESCDQRVNSSTTAAAATTIMPTVTAIAAPTGAFL
jgi:hypothetical protein